MIQITVDSGLSELIRAGARYRKIEVVHLLALPNVLFLVSMYSFCDPTLTLTFLQIYTYFHFSAFMNMKQVALQG